MPVIVVPTDFSPSSENAARYAASLAQKIGAELHLLHYFQIPVAPDGLSAQPLDGGFTQAPAYLLPLEELQASAEKNLGDARQGLERQFPDLAVRGHCGVAGNLAADINAYCEDVAPFAVIIGSHRAEGLESWLGNTAASLAKHLHYPVIAVPEAFEGGAGPKFVLATDLEPIPQSQVSLITAFVQQLDGQLQLVHITTTVEEERGEAPEHLQALFQPLQTAYSTIYNESVTEGLLQYLEKAAADLIIVLPHHHSFWEKLFFKLHTKDLVSKMPVPVLCIPQPKI